jgi:hypothetical protein
VSSRENAAAKARRLLVEGRVRITGVAPYQVSAVVRGDSAAVYDVRYDGRSWSCACDAYSTLCSHVQAVMLVTVVNEAAA